MKHTKLSKKEVNLIFLEHIASGDKSDGIPNVLSNDDTFVDSTKRQSPLRKAAKATIIREMTTPDLPELEKSGTVTKDIKRNWQRNQRLIDFANIPAEYRTSILEQYNKLLEYKYKDTSRGFSLYKYLLKNDMKIMADCVEELMIGEY